MDLDAKTTNTPVVRFGSIDRVDAEPIDQMEGGHSQESLVVEICKTMSPSCLADEETFDRDVFMPIGRRSPGGQPRTNLLKKADRRKVLDGVSGWPSKFRRRSARS